MNCFVCTNAKEERRFAQMYCAARSDHVETWVSLRFGHVRVLTPHRGVIHYPRAASLPYGLRGLSVYCITKFFTAVSESTLRMTAGGCLRWAFVFGTSKPVPYRFCAGFVCAVVCVYYGTSGRRPLQNGCANCSQI